MTSPEAGKGGAGSGLATLYVGDLLPHVTETHLNDKFQGFGPIAMIHVCRDSVSRRSLGYAYVNYYSHVDAQHAMDKLNYTDIEGRCCRIMWNKKERQSKANEDANIFVKNLDPSIDSKSLFDTFSMFGHILSCKVATDSSGSSRGYGFVQYESEDAAKQATERVNGMLIGGRTVYVGPFKKRDYQQSITEAGSDCNVYVRNIPGTWDDTQVTELFLPFGEVVSSLICHDGKSERRYGFINFKDADAASKAIEALHGKDTRTEEEKKAMEEEEELKEKARAAEAEAEAEAKAAKADAEKSADEETKPAQEEAKADGAEPESKGDPVPAEAASDKAPAAELTDGAGDSSEKQAAPNTDAAAAPDAPLPKTERLPVYCLFVGRSKTKAEREVESKKRQEARQDRFEGIKLYIRNLPNDMTDDKLKALFTSFGEVTDVKAVLDRDSGACKGYGFVRFATTEEATAAVSEMHLKEAIPGQLPLHVGLATGKGSGPERGREKGEKGGGFGAKGFGGSQKGGKGLGKFGGCNFGGKGKGFGASGPGYPNAAFPQQAMPAMYYQLPPGAAAAPGMPGIWGAPLPMMRPPMMPAGFPIAPLPGMPGAIPAPQPGQMRVQPGYPPQPMPAPPRPSQPLATNLAQAPPNVRKQMIGERMFPAVSRIEPQLAGKITGMLLEMEEGELLTLLESEDTLREKVAEAVQVLGRVAK